MSASAEEQQPDIKVHGHQAAEKMAGGVRIARKTRPSETDKPGTHDDEFEAEEAANNETASQNLAKQMKESYPTEAVKAFHEKPQPAKQPHTNFAPKPHSHDLFQPRKQ
uniref:Death-associated protein 1 n=1 Tax=Panagrolaimus sp. ES5 TaxID=591445 RepID=A0AC34FCJ0_9BILA